MINNTANNTNLQQLVAKGVLWNAIRTWSARAFSFVITLVLVHYLMPDAFGLVAYASVFIAFIEIFLDQGFSDALVQLPELTQEHLDTAFWTNLLVGILLTIIGITTSGVVARYANETRLAPILSWLSLSFTLGALSGVPQAVLRRKLDYQKLGICYFAATVTSGLAAVVMAMIGFGAWSLVSKTIVNGLVVVMAIWKTSDWHPRLNFSIQRFKELFNYGINIIGSNLVDFFSRRSDDFLIGYFLGGTALGYYTIAYNLLLTLTDLIISVPTDVAFPAFSRLQEKPEKVSGTFYEAAKFISSFSSPVLLGMIAVAPEFISVLYGKSWEPSITVTRVLMLVGIIHSSFFFFGNTLKAFGKPGWRFRFLTLVGFLNVLGFYLTVRLGIVAIASSYAIIGYLTFPIYFKLVSKVIRIDLRTYIYHWVPALIASIVMCVVIMGLRYVLSPVLELHLQLSLYILAGALTYLIVIGLLQPLLFKSIINLARMAFSVKGPRRTDSPQGLGK